MYPQSRTKKIAKIVAVILAAILVVVLAIVFFRRTPAEQGGTETRGRFFVDLGSLFVGKRPDIDPSGVEPFPDGTTPGTDGTTPGTTTPGTVPTTVPGVSPGGQPPQPIGDNRDNSPGIQPNYQFSDECAAAGAAQDPRCNLPSLSSAFVYLSAAPQEVARGGRATITWSSQNAERCVASASPSTSGWSGSLSASGSRTVTVSTATTFVIQCRNVADITEAVQASDSVNIALSVDDGSPVPGDTMPQATISVAPASVAANSQTTVTWQASNVTSCAASRFTLDTAVPPQGSNIWSGNIGSSGSLSVWVGTMPVTYIITCVGPGGTTQDSATVDIAIPGSPLAQATIGLSPDRIARGSVPTTVVNWSSVEAASCSAATVPTNEAGGNWTGSVALFGSRSVTIGSTPVTFVLTCTTAAGDVVQDAATLDFFDDLFSYLQVQLDANPTFVVEGGSSMLYWQSSRAASCTASALPARSDWSGFVALSDSQTVALGSTPTTFIVRCTGPDGIAQSDVTVSVISEAADPGFTDFCLDNPNDVRCSFPLDPCAGAGAAANPWCNEVPFAQDELPQLILTPEEEGRISLLMREVAMMAPTLPSNQTASNLEISTQTYLNIVRDTGRDIQACYDLNRDQQWIDAVWDRQLQGRRHPPTGFSIGLLPTVNGRPFIPENIEDLRLSPGDRGTLINRYPVSRPSNAWVAKMAAQAPEPNPLTRNACTGDRSGEYQYNNPGPYFNTTFKVYHEGPTPFGGTFIYPFYPVTCWGVRHQRSSDASSDYRDSDINEGLSRMQFQVEDVSSGGHNNPQFNYWWY